MFASQHMGAEDQTQVLCKNDSAHNHGASSPDSPFLYGFENKIVWLDMVVMPIISANGAAAERSGL